MSTTSEPPTSQPDKQSEELTPRPAKRSREDEWFLSDSIESPQKRQKPPLAVTLRSGKTAKAPAPAQPKDAAAAKYFEMAAFPPMLRPEKDLPRVMERVSYPVIFKNVMQYVRTCLSRGCGGRVLVTGNTGVGLSRFYLYCAFRLLKEQQHLDLDKYTLVLNCEHEYHVYRKATREFERVDGDALQALQQNAEALRLIDANTDQWDSWQGVSLLFASPEVENMHSFRRQMNCQTYITPVWSLDELKQCNALMPRGRRLLKKDLEARFLQFGGIPRSIFDPNQAAIVEELDRLISAVVGADVVRRFRLKGFHTDWGNRLLKMVPTSPTYAERFRFEFVSEEIQTRVLEEMDTDSILKLDKAVMVDEAMLQLTKAR